MKMHKGLANFVRFLGVFNWLVVVAAAVAAIWYLWSGHGGEIVVLSVPCIMMIVLLGGLAYNVEGAIRAQTEQIAALEAKLGGGDQHAEPL